MPSTLEPRLTARAVRPLLSGLAHDELARSRGTAEAVPYDHGAR